MNDLVRLRNDPQMRRAVEDELAATYADTGYALPTADDVITTVLAQLSIDLRDQARELGDCGKIDNCTAEAVVLDRLATWLEEQ